MGKTDMSYYKDLAIRIAGANLGSTVEKLATGRSTLIGSAVGSKFLKDKFTKPKVVNKKKGGKVK